MLISNASLNRSASTSTSFLHPNPSSLSLSLPKTSLGYRPGYQSGRTRRCSNLSSSNLSSASSLKHSLQAAKKNLDSGVSPGAGLASAEEQAEAAYADLILTSMGDDETADGLSQERLSSLQEGGNMPKTGLKQQGGIVDVLQALVGGAHIVKQPDGRV